MRYPHGLTPATLRVVETYEAAAKIIGTNEIVDVSRAFDEDRLAIRSDTELEIDGASVQTGGYLLVPSPPTPAFLAEMASRALNSRDKRATLVFDAHACEFRLTYAAKAPIHVTLGDLARVMGFPNVPLSYGTRCTPIRPAVATRRAASSHST